MKLAEALQERADLQREIEQLRVRLNNNMLVQEGEQTAEDPEVLHQELEAAFSRVTVLTAQINHTNCTVKSEGQTLTELIAEKDVLTQKLQIQKVLVQTASQRIQRARNTEIRIRSAINVAEWQAEINRMAKNLRILDNRLQQTNWSVDLIEN